MFCVIFYNSGHQGLTYGCNSFVTSLIVSWQGLLFVVPVSVQYSYHFCGPPSFAPIKFVQFLFCVIYDKPEGQRSVQGRR